MQSAAHHWEETMNRALRGPVWSTVKRAGPEISEGLDRVQQFQHLIFSPEHQTKPRPAFPQLMRTLLPFLHADKLSVFL